MVLPQRPSIGIALAGGAARGIAHIAVREGLEGNLCRCTGYHNIVQSVLAGAKAGASK